jgi:hypothetical protein
MWKTTRNLAKRQVPWQLTGSIQPPFVGGRWYGIQDKLGTSYIILANNRLFAMPVYVPVTSFTQAILMVQYSALVGKHARLGLYADNGGVPGALIFDAGLVPTDTQEERSLPMALRLRPGWYWMAMLYETNNSRPFDVQYGYPPLMGHATNTETDIHAFVYAAQAYGALPANFPAVTYGGTAHAPYMAIQALSGMEDTDDGWKLTQDVEEGTRLLLPHRSGRYYGFQFGAGAYPALELQLAVDTLYAMPFSAPDAHAYDRISVHVTTAGAAGTLARLGVYADADGVPGALILDAGTVAVDAAAGVEININQTLTPGWYWLVALTNGTPKFRTHVGADMLGWLGFSSGTDVTCHAGVTAAQAYGVLPANFPACALGDVPRVMLRAT